MAPSSAAAPAAAIDRSVDDLLDDPHSVLRLRVLRAARHAIAQHGLGVSMDQLADAAGVGRRTLFRRFDGRDALVADAVISALEWYDRRMERVSGGDQPLDAWLVALMDDAHETHRTAGRGLWQLAASDDADLPPELARVNQVRRAARHAMTHATAAEAWRRGGGTGRCPTVVVDACALTMSLFATRSLVDDLGRDPHAVALSTSAMLSALVRAEVAARADRRTHSG